MPLAPKRSLRLFPTALADGCTSSSHVIISGIMFGPVQVMKREEPLASVVNPIPLTDMLFSNGRPASVQFYLSYGRLQQMCISWKSP